MKTTGHSDTPTQRAVLYVVGPAAAWLVTQLMNRPKARETRKRIDDAVIEQGEKAMKAVRRRSKNAAKNLGYLAAGLATMAIGIGLITRATRK